MGDGPVPPILKGTQGWEGTPPACPALLCSFPTCPVLSPAPQPREGTGTRARGLTSPGSSACSVGEAMALLSLSSGP